MKIVHKLVLTQSVVIFLVIVLGISGGGAIIWMKRSVDELEKASFRASLVKSLSVATHQWVISVESVLRGESLLDYFSMNTVLLEESIFSLMGETIPVEEKEILEAILTLFNNIKDQTKGLRGDGKTMSEEEEKICIRELLSKVEILESRHESHMDMVKARANKTKNLGAYISIAIPSTCVILIIVFGLSVGRGIIYSISYLVSATKTMAAGDLAKVVDLRSKDEFGVLAGAFDNMRDRLMTQRDNLKELNKTLEQRMAERKQAEEKLIAYQKQLKSLASELSLTEERERRRIASDLHDSIGQALIVVKMKLEELREMKISIVVDSLLYDSHKLLEKTIQDTRSLIFELSPPVLYVLGFEPAVEGLIEQIQEQHDIMIDFMSDGQLKPLDEDIRVLLFKAIRELLFNIVKHANAQNAKVFIKRDVNNIRIEVEDDGVGFNATESCFKVSKTGGFGLFNIRERLEHLGGHLEIKSEPGNGTRVALVALLKSEEEM